MIHSPRAIVKPVANIVFCYVFPDLKSGDGRTKTCVKTIIPTGREFALQNFLDKITFKTRISTC